MTDTDDIPPGRRRVPRWVIVSAAALLAVAVVIGGGVGIYRLGADAAREPEHEEPPATDVAFWWDLESPSPALGDPKYDLIRAWVESRILASDHGAVYPGFLAATTPDSFDHADLGFRGLIDEDARVGTYRLHIAAFSASATVTNAQVCVDGLGVSSISGGGHSDEDPFANAGPLEVRTLGWHAIDLTMQRPVESTPIAPTDLDGELPSEQPLPPPDIFGDWVATSATTVQSEACALWWAGRYGPQGDLVGPSSQPRPPEGNIPGW